MPSAADAESASSTLAGAGAAALSAALGVFIEDLNGVSFAMLALSAPTPPFPPFGTAGGCLSHFYCPDDGGHYCCGSLSCTLQRTCSSNPALLHCACPNVHIEPSPPPPPSPPPSSPPHAPPPPSSPPLPRTSRPPPLPSPSCPPLSPLSSSPPLPSPPRLPLSPNPLIIATSSKLASSTPSSYLLLAITPSLAAGALCIILLLRERFCRHKEDGARRASPHAGPAPPGVSLRVLPNFSADRSRAVSAQGCTAPMSQPVLGDVQGYAAIPTAAAAEAPPPCLQHSSQALPSTDHVVQQPCMLNKMDTRGWVQPGRALLPPLSFPATSRTHHGGRPIVPEIVRRSGSPPSTPSGVSLARYPRSG